MSDRHIAILRAVADQLQARLRAERARERAAARPDSPRSGALGRSSARADARLAAAQARRVFPSTPIARPAATRAAVTTEPAAATPADIDASYPAVAGSVPEARRSVSRWLCLLQADPLMIGDVELVVSEACTNAVVHGYRDTIRGIFRVRAQRNNGSVCVTVSDDGSGMAPRADSPGLGLGLPLMAALTDRLEVAPAFDGAGTVVRMHFSAAGAARRIP